MSAPTTIIFVDGAERERLCGRRSIVSSSHERDEERQPDPEEEQRKEAFGCAFVARPAGFVKKLAWAITTPAA